MTVITGEGNTRMISVLALRGALKLQTKGFGNRGRSPLTITNELLGSEHRAAKAAYPALNDYIVSILGPDFSRPL
jgi:hypothetical protein